MYTGSQSINGRNKNSSVSLVFIRKPSPGNGLSVSGRLGFVKLSIMYLLPACGHGQGL